MAALIALGLSGCAAQSGSSSSFWPASLFHSAPPPPPPPATTRQAPAARGQELGEIGPEESEQPAESPKPTPPAGATQPSKPAPEVPKAVVTSTMNGATRDEALAAISQVNKRLAAAESLSPGGTGSDQINVVRKLRDNAQRAFDEQDYLTARSLAQKASVLAARLPAGASAH